MCAKAAARAAELGVDLPTLAIKAAVQEPRIATSLVGFRKPEEVRSLSAGSRRLDMAPIECHRRPCILARPRAPRPCAGLCAAEPPVRRWLPHAMAEVPIGHASAHHMERWTRRHHCRPAISTAARARIMIRP